MAPLDVDRASTPWPHPLRGPWSVTCHFAVVNGRRECVGIDVRSFKIDDDGAYRLLRRGSRLEVVTAALIRSLPVASLIRDLRRGLSDVARHAANDPERSEEDRTTLLARSSELAKSPRRVHDDDHFARVADIYRDAWSAGDSPTKAVAEQMGTTRSAAAKWVSRARQLGLLGATEQRVAGGVQAGRRKGTR